MGTEIPEKFKDKPEEYFILLEKKDNEKRIKKLENELEEMKTLSEKYYWALYRIRAVVDIRKRRMKEIRETLDEAGIEQIRRDYEELDE